MKQLDLTEINLDALREDARSTWDKIGWMRGVTLSQLQARAAFYDDNDELVCLAGLRKPQSVFGRPELWIMPGKGFSAKHIRPLRIAMCEIVLPFAPVWAVAAAEFDRFTRLFGFVPIGATAHGTLYEVR